MKSIGLLAFLCVIPVILILTIVYSKDKKREPVPLLLGLFVFGILSCSIVLTLSDLLKPIFPFLNMRVGNMDLLNLFLYSFIGVALLEEFSKWLMVFCIGYQSKEFNEYYDSIVYAVFVSLGFAFLENILYVFQIGDIHTAFLRAISAVPGHACDAIFMGYYLSRAKQFQLRGRKDLELRNIGFSIIVPTILHGIYDFLLMTGNYYMSLVFIVFIGFLFMSSFLKLKEFDKDSKNTKKVFCSKCGRKLKRGKCKVCDKRQGH